MESLLADESGEEEETSVSHEQNFIYKKKVYKYCFFKVDVILNIVHAYLFVYFKHKLSYPSYLPDACYFLP